MASGLTYFIKPVIEKTNITAVNTITKQTDKSFVKLEKTANKTFKKTDSGAKKSKKEQDKLNDSVKKGTGLYKKIGAAVGAFASVAVIKKFYGESIAASREQARVETNLLAVLKNVRGLQGDTTAIEKGFKELTNYASALQDIGVIGDEVIISGQQQLATFQLMPSTVKTLSKGMADLLAQQKGFNATTADSQNIANLFGKVMEGQVGALTRVGISFTDAQEKVLKYGNEEQKAATLAEVLEMNVGGVNAALRATDDGKIKAASNSFGDMQERIGARLIPQIAKFTDLLLSNLPTIEGFIVKGTDALITFTDYLIKGIGFLTEHKVIVLGIVGAIAAYKTITTAATIITQGMTAAQVLWNIALSANPIGLVIAGIAGLVGAGVLLYQNWDLVKTKTLEFWEVLRNTPIAEFITDAFSSVFEVFDKIFAGIKKVTGALNFFGKKKVNVDTEFNFDESEFNPANVNVPIKGNSIEEPFVNNINNSRNNNQSNVNITIPVNNSVNGQQLAAGIKKRTIEEIQEYNRQQLALIGGW